MADANRYALPKDYAERYGPWAVIAGGSEGTGESFARMLAGAGINLVLLARREGPLQALAKSIESEHGIEVRPASVDLTARDLVDRVRTITDDLEVGLLIYNAGSAIGYHRFPDWPIEDLDFMINLNCYAPVHLAHHFSKGMCERGHGGLMFLSSLAAFAGSSHMTIYPATKAFDQMLGEGLWHDLKPAGVDSLSLIVGATRTASHGADRVDFAAMGGDLPDGGAMQSDDVAHEGLMQLGRRPLWVVGEHNRAALPEGFIEGRPLAIEAMSSATAAIMGLDHVSAID